MIFVDQAAARDESGESGTPSFASGQPVQHHGCAAFDENLKHYREPIDTSPRPVLPSKLRPEEVPKPADTTVTVRELPAGRFAVLRFSGGRNAKKEAESLARLKTWMSAEALGVTSPPVYGYFDPPWTPAFLRRNEVMLRTEAGQ